MLSFPLPRLGVLAWSALCGSSGNDLCRPIWDVGCGKTLNRLPLRALRRIGSRSNRGAQPVFRWEHRLRRGFGFEVLIFGVAPTPQPEAFFCFTMLVHETTSD